jgi:hypothetical protein
MLSSITFRERSFVKVDLQGPNEISTGSLEDVTEDVNLNFCKKEGSHIPVSGLYNDNNRCQIPGSPPEDNIQKSNNSNQGSDVTTSGIENSEQETDQLGHVLLSKNTGSCLLHEREIQHFSASLFQIRQEGVELKEMVKAARIEQHCELQSANTLLQFLKMKIDSEVSSLRTEVDELREQVRNFFSDYGTPIEREEEMTAGHKMKMALDAGQMRRLPPWKQEVTDKEGRRRFHGAFTGGFSAGFYNTVGSKEGWAPRTFMSSRKKRAEVKGQTVYSFLDDDEKAEFDAQELSASSEFDTFGFTAAEVARKQANKDTGGTLKTPQAHLAENESSVDIKGIQVAIKVN